VTFKFRSQPDRDRGRVIVNVFVGECDEALRFAGLLTLKTKEWQTFADVMTTQDILHILIEGP
jgi:hypothetical protein